MPLALPGDRGAPEETYAEVALVPALPGKDLLTYRVPAAHRLRIRAGMRVLVPLGRRRETGLVVELCATPPTAGLGQIRDVIEILDSDPIVTPDLFALCRWAARYYCTTLADVLAAALPGGLRATSERLVTLAPSCPADAARRPLESAILAHLRSAGATTMRQLARAVGREPRGNAPARAESLRLAAAVRALAGRGAVIVEDHLREPRGKTSFRALLVLERELSPDQAAALHRRAPRQRVLYDRLLAEGAAGLDTSDLTNAERAAAGALTRRGLVGRRHEERYRRVVPSQTGGAAAPLVLSAPQQEAVDSALAAPGFATFLLHGVTGSGKTEVYARIAASKLAAGRSVLFLVPEIALTHRLVLGVEERFGSTVALLHSGLGPGERWDEWRRIARGEARVVVGTRSAVFAPLADLGLVVVDEEHDAAYKQDEGLRYHGRDLALVRAKLAGAVAVLGSATPSLESHQRALEGKFRLLSLPARVAGRPLPEVDLVDLRRPESRLWPQPAAALAAQPHAGPPQAGDGRATTLFSPYLLDAIRNVLERREQVLLFLNRRGFAKSLQCLACGEPAGCPSCSVSLTLHARRGALLCHHCGYTRRAGAPCAACGGATLSTSGEGTERAETEIARLFPQARIGRLDRDTTGRKGAHGRILDAWSAGALDILIGTQMVAKGHDVPAVTLVGVLLADVAVNLPDFRAAERAFQLLTQVAGRAGRGDCPGRVIVQTYRPQHHCLLAAAAHDYASFAPRELAHRRELGYPPFARLAVLRVEGVEAAATEATATDLAARARSLAAAGAATVRGPAPAPLERLRGRYRWHVLLSAATAGGLHALLRPLLVGWRASGAARRMRLVVDVDPVSML